MRRLTALVAMTAISTIIVTGMVGCAPTPGQVKTASGLTTNEVNEKAWAMSTVDDQFQICAAYQSTPKAVATAMYRNVTTIPGETLALITAFLEEKCS